MGFITNVSISNDFWHDIARNPEKLIDGIGWAMNYGTNSPLGETLDAQRNSGDPDGYLWEMRRSVPQGVTVHHARHMDEPQLIVNTYGSNPVNAAEIPSAIRHGWIGLNPYNRTHAERIAETLEFYAELIRDSLRAEDRRAKLAERAKADRLREEDDRFRDAEHRDESLETDEGVE